MDALLSVNWMSFLVLAITLLCFKFLHWISHKIKWIFIMLLALLIGAVIGIVFASAGNTYLTWLNVIGQVYVKVITALVAPVIILCVISGLITLNDKEKMKSIGTKSVFWLLVSSAIAIAITMIIGSISHIGTGAGAAFSDLSSVTSNEIDAYNKMGTTFDAILLNLVPSNVIGDMSNNNIVAIIIMAVAVAVAYINVSAKEGENAVSIIKQIIEASKKIVFRILGFVIKQTPYAVLCLMAVSASQLLSDSEALTQLVLLIALIFVICLIQSYVVNAILLKFVAKLNPFKFFRKTFDIQATAFTTSSSVGTMPITQDRLVNRIGIDEAIANFTTPLSTTLGMAGGTCIWPILLVLFYINATGATWDAGQYLIMCFMCLVLSLGSAGMPGVGVVTAVSMFSAVGLPVAAVVLLMPINNITDMIRTLTNVTDGATAAAIVARKNNLLNDEILNKDQAEEVA